MLPHFLRQRAPQGAEHSPPPAHAAARSSAPRDSRRPGGPAYTRARPPLRFAFPHLPVTPLPVGYVTSRISQWETVLLQLGPSCVMAAPRPQAGERNRDVEFSVRSTVGFGGPSSFAESAVHTEVGNALSFPLTYRVRLPSRDLGWQDRWSEDEEVGRCQRGRPACTRRAKSEGGTPVTIIVACRLLEE